MICDTKLLSYNFDCSYQIKWTVIYDMLPRDRLICILYNLGELACRLVELHYCLVNVGFARERP